MNTFVCPVCGTPFVKDAHTYQCSKGHSFDIAKSGYVNLLISKNSLAPGDNKLMVDARQAFLEKGYYKPLSDEVSRLVEKYLSGKDAVLLDAGCGEGYYTSRVQRHLLTRGYTAAFMGIDISKTALNKAAKRDKDIDYAVASIFHIPVQEHSCDMFLNLFAPFCEEEILRILKESGIMIMVIPGQNHLWELKEFIYDTPYKNHVKEYGLPGFVLKEHQHLSYLLELASQQDVDNLFKMTPYYYKTAVENYNRILSLQSFCTQAEFELLVYQRE